MEERSKRPGPSSSENPDLFVPATELANTDSLSDRQKLARAYQTETQIRFDKLQGLNKSTTLQSKYLYDVYPMENTGEKFENLIERDRAAFQRKAVPFLRVSQLHDGSLTMIDIRNHERHENHLVHDEKNLPVPPNFLFFEILLEAFLGYKLSGLYNSDDPTMPRAALMGGAVVAALCSWNEFDFQQQWDDLERKLFSQQDTANESDGSMSYVETKRLITINLHKCFLSRYEDDLTNNETERKISIFHEGDVDVFLQPSPLMRSLYSKLHEYGLTLDDVDRVASFCGGIGLCHGDLQRFSERLLNRLRPKYHAWATFCYSLAKNGLSFILALNDDPDYEYWDSDREKIPWPRTTQLIILDLRADLLGALLDFDLSASTCAYDGVTVRVAPRAAYSLVTRTCVSTPFTIEEMRNRKRIVKYYKRGFDCAILDPCCSHDPACNNFTTVIENFGDVRKGGVVWGRAIRGDEHVDEVAEYQDEYWDNEDHGLVGFCCSNAENNKLYSLAMFEKSEGDATRFLARLNNWSDEELATVLQTPNELRTCCKHCRLLYSMTLFFKEESSMDGSVEDILHGDKAFKYSNGRSGFLSPSFYNGGAFDPTLVRSSARHIHKAKGVLKAQSLAERVRYIMKHGNEIGYVDRFTHGDDLEKVFTAASRIVLPGSNRAPVGLNPERFIASCDYCHAWLHGCEYGTRFCKKCATSKVVAKKPREV